MVDPLMGQRVPENVILMALYQYPYPRINTGSTRKLQFQEDGMASTNNSNFKLMEN
jgi:hypothetical protein